MIRFDPQITEAMAVHAANCLPEECCGLLASDGESFRMAYPLTNADHSATSYTIEPVEHFRALRHAEARGWEITGVFHSHPTTEAYPSPTDVRLAPDPSWVYVVLGRVEAGAPTVRAFRIVDGVVSELSVGP